MMFGASASMKAGHVLPWAWWVEGADSSVDTEPKVPLLPAAGAGYSVNPDGPMPCHQRAEGAACRVNPATMVPLPLAGGASDSVKTATFMPCRRRVEGAVFQLNPGTSMPSPLAAGAKNAMNASSALPLSATLATGHNAKPPALEALAACNWLTATQGGDGNGHLATPFYRIPEGRTRGCALSDPAEIFLSGGAGVALVDAVDFAELRQWRWSLHLAGGRHQYAVRNKSVTGNKRGRTLAFMHREIMAPGSNVRVKHINGNGLDNRRSNLRLFDTKPQTAADRIYRANYKLNGPSQVAKHRLSNISPTDRVAVCAECGPVNIKLKRKPNGKEYFRCTGYDAHRRWIARATTEASREFRVALSGNYRKYKKSHCERCGFVPAHPIQLDVHHRDHNHGNHGEPNLETVCANCHRLEHLVRWFPDGWAAGGIAL